ncbi:MAG TPA: hypothetical protein VLC98_09350 [Phnomibacter sp.]|nr:hypothetical protein [Phnomibacter sp.]
MAVANKTMLFLAQITLVVCMIICLSFYVSYKRTIENEKPIEYSLMSQTQSYWRGTNYKMAVFYNRENHLVSISGKMSDSIALGKMPSLYYNDFTSSVISDYHRSMALKVLSVLGILAFLSFLLKTRKNY